MHTYKDLGDAVNNDGGILTTTMETLKTIQGAGRLGVNVRQAISGKLASNGLGHLPGELPPNQWEEVRIYRLGTPIAEVIHAVTSPSAKGDEILRSVASSEAQEQLQQIRAIVCG